MEENEESGQPPPSPHLDQASTSTDISANVKPTFATPQPKKKQKRKRPTQLSDTKPVKTGMSSADQTTDSNSETDSENVISTLLNSFSPTESDRGLFIRRGTKSAFRELKQQNDLTFTSHLLSQTDRVVIFSSREQLSKFSAKFSPLYFGPKAIFEALPNSTLTAPWLTALDRTRTPNLPPSPVPETPPNPSENDWKTVTHAKRKPVLTPAIPQTSTHTDPASSEQKYTVKIHNHSLNTNNPFFIKDLITQNHLQIPTPRYFWAYTTRTTTLLFPNIQTAEKFVHAIPPDSFGPHAKLILMPAHMSATQPPPPKDISVVIKSIEHSISMDTLKQELLDQGYKVKNVARIISAQTRTETQLVRAFLEDVETSDAMLRGVLLCGKFYRVEPSKEFVRLRPCLQCAQYGHDNSTCNNIPKCHKCGQNPNICKTKHTTNEKYCATCDSKDHYTGQIICTKYPRNPQSLQPLENKPRHVAILASSPTPPIKPSQAFPALIPTPSQSPNNTTFASITREGTPNITTSSPVKTLAIPEPHPTPTPEARKATTSKKTDDSIPVDLETVKTITKNLEKYIDDKISALEDKLMTFIVALLASDETPVKRKATLKTANTTAKKILKKRVLHNFIDKKLRVTIEPMNFPPQHKTRTNDNACRANDRSNTDVRPSSSTTT